ncbi:MAG TPA: DUF3048 domain-containing protein [Candidatus Dormibacteraeota bacterium]|nr:DUF3048 domain-containing protein [Candidatus Dormibacteraeota bacterium]
MIDDFRPLDGSTEPAAKLEQLLKPVEDKKPEAEPKFKPPETVAADDQATPDAPEKTSPAPVKKHWWQKLHIQWWPPDKKVWLGLVIILLLALGGIDTYINLHKSVLLASKTPVKHLPVIVKPKKPTTVASTLSGLQVDPSTNKIPVTGVMIENSIFARPQSGLSQASVVFEAIAEGGITRYLALFQDTAPSNIGPIRSARPYYLGWALGFDASLAHVGGSPEALADITTWGVKNLDQFFNGSYYHRITQRDAPHNVYTSIAELNALEQAKGYSTTNFSGFPRKADSPSKVPTAKTIDFNISGPDYAVHYDYNPTTNSYARSVGGSPDIDANNNNQISPKVVIALVIPYSLEADGEHSVYGLIGTGQAYVFEDGNVVVGNWTKSAATSQISFTDSNNQPLKLNAGQTWLTAVGASNNVTYKP